MANKERFDEIVGDAIPVIGFVILIIGIFAGIFFISDPVELFTDTQNNFIIGIFMFAGSYFIYMMLASVLSAYKAIHIILTLISTAGLATMVTGISIIGGCNLFYIPESFIEAPIGYGFLLLVVGTIVGGVFAPFGGKGVTERLIIRLRTFLKDQASK